MFLLSVALLWFAAYADTCKKCMQDFKENKGCEAMVKCHRGGLVCNQVDWTVFFTTMDPETCLSPKCVMLLKCSPLKTCKRDKMKIVGVPDEGCLVHGKAFDCGPGFMSLQDWYYDDSCTDENKVWATSCKPIHGRPCWSELQDMRSDDYYYGGGGDKLELDKCMSRNEGEDHYYRIMKCEEGVDCMGQKAEQCGQQCKECISCAGVNSWDCIMRCEKCDSCAPFAGCFREEFCEENKEHECLNKCKPCLGCYDNRMYYSEECDLCKSNGKDCMNNKCKGYVMCMTGGLEFCDFENLSPIMKVMKEHIPYDQYLTCRKCVFESPPVDDTLSKDVCQCLLAVPEDVVEKNDCWLHPKSVGSMRLTCKNVWEKKNAVLLTAKMLRLNTRMTEGECEAKCGPKTEFNVDCWDCCTGRLSPLKCGCMAKCLDDPNQYQCWDYCMGQISKLEYDCDVSCIPTPRPPMECDCYTRCRDNGNASFCWDLCIHYEWVEEVDCSMWVYDSNPFDECYNPCISAGERMISRQRGRAHCWE